MENSSNNPLVNYHSHTYRCKHASGEVLEFVKAASEAGLEIFGVSDHAAFPDDRWPDVRMSYEELDNYVEAVRAAQLSVPKLRVLLGMECELVPEFKNYLEDELLGERQFDYLIGAGHYTPHNGEWLNSFTKLNYKPYLKSYTEHLCQMMESKLFAFIAHPDIFGCTNFKWDTDLNAFSREILRTAEETQTPLEINGNGLRKKYINSSEGLRPPYPWRPFWELASEFKIKVVCNSDCHFPNEVVAGISENIKLARSLGLELADLSHIH